MLVQVNKLLHTKLALTWHFPVKAIKFQDTVARQVTLLSAPSWLQLKTATLAVAK
jgi:hypothetical protein